MLYWGIVPEAWLQCLRQLFGFTSEVKPGQSDQAYLRHKPVNRADRLGVIDIESHEIVLLAGARLGCVEEWILRAEINTARISNLARITKADYGGRIISHLIVDIDYFGGIICVIDELMRIRNTYPKIVVVLVSDDFTHDDFNCERLAICDVSLRFPFNLAALEFGLTEATNINNPIWQERLSRSR